MVPLYCFPVNTDGSVKSLELFYYFTEFLHGLFPVCFTNPILFLLKTFNRGFPSVLPAEVLCFQGVTPRIENTDFDSLVSLGLIPLGNGDGKGTAQPPSTDLSIPASGINSTLTFPVIWRFFFSDI